MMHRSPPGTGTPIMDFVMPPKDGPILGYTPEERGNLYTYALNNPVNLVDPSGLVPISCECKIVIKGHSAYFKRTTNCGGLASTCCEASCKGPSTSWTGKWELIPQQPPSPNWGEGSGNFHKTVHQIKFSVSFKGTGDELRRNVYNDLKSFKHFNDGVNDVATVKIKDDIAYFNALGLMGIGSDFINADKSPVKLEFNDGSFCVLGTTLHGHMLEGQRSWSVTIERGEDCLWDVIIKSVAYERKVGWINDLGARAAGTEEQMKIWDQYFMNIQKAYNGGMRDRWHRESDTGSSRFPMGWGCK